MSQTISPGDFVEVIAGCPGCSGPTPDPDVGQRFQVQWVLAAKDGGDVHIECAGCGNKMTTPGLVRLAYYRGYHDEKDAHPSVFLKKICSFADLEVLQRTGPTH